MEAMMGRVRRLAAAAAAAGVRLMVDAEHTYFQPVGSRELWGAGGGGVVRGVGQGRGLGTIRGKGGHVTGNVLQLTMFAAGNSKPCDARNVAAAQAWRQRYNQPLRQPPIGAPHLPFNHPPHSSLAGHRPHGQGAVPGVQQRRCRARGVQHLPGLPEGQPPPAGGGHGARAAGGVRLCG